MPSEQFSAFLTLFPKDSEYAYPLDGTALSREIKEHFQVNVPVILTEFWNTVGYGYFGSRDFYFFGPERQNQARDSLFEWNRKDYWSQVFPSPAEGGPLYFAETCFGQQLGFGLEADRVVACLLDIDTMKFYNVADPFDQLFAKTLAKRCPFMDDSLHDAIHQKFGPVPVGMHLAPTVSMLVGGSYTPENYHIETPNIHLRTTIATWEACR